MARDADREEMNRRRFLRDATGWLLTVPALGYAVACAKTAATGELTGPELPDVRDALELPEIAAADLGAETAEDPGTDEGQDPGTEAGEDPGPDTPATPGRTLSPARFIALSALVDAMIPDDGTPGAAKAGAADYVDTLLGAFAYDPPRIFAGGPYSGRHGGLDGFSSFVPLTRVEEIAWRIRIEGTQGKPERAFATVGADGTTSGDLPGFLAQYQQGLDDLDAQAVAQGYVNFADMPAIERLSLIQGGAAGLDTRQAFEHAVEGTYGDPVYGGNRDLAGWKAIDYEGDRQPRGYTARQMTHPEEG